MRRFLLILFLISLSTEGFSKPDSYAKNQKIQGVLSHYKQNAEYRVKESNSTLLNYYKANFKEYYHSTNQDYFQLGIYIVSDLIQNKEITEATTFIKILRQDFHNLKPKQQSYLLYWEAVILFYNKQYKNSLNKLHKIQYLFPNGLSIEFKNKLNYYLGSNYSRLKNYSKSKFYLERIIFNSNLKSKEYYKAINRLTFDYIKLNNISGAAYLLEKVNLNPGIEQKNNIILSMGKLLQLRAYIYRQFANHNKDSLTLIQKSLADSEQSVYCLNNFIRKQHFEKDQLQFNQDYNYFFYKTIEAIDRVYQQSPNESLLFKAFYYAELDKNLSVLRYFKREKSRINSYIPKNEVQKSDSLHDLLRIIEDKVYRLENRYHVPDSLLLNAYLEQSRLVQEINRKEQKLEKDYPAYYYEKFKLPEPDIDYLKQLSQKKQILEYVISDEKVYSFLISKGKIYTHHFEYSDSLFSKLANYRKLIGDSKSIKFTDAEFYQFNKLSYSLYKQLLKPFEKYFCSLPLLIIPDNELNLIPFETLIRKPYTGKMVDYSNLYYLVNDFDISYANSIEILKYQEEESKQASLKGILSYAPSYKKLPGHEGSQYLALRDARDGLGELIGAKEEVKAIKRKTSIVNYFDSDASEYSFKNESGNYAVVHCAMHTLIDNKNPLYSKLVFTPDADTIEDGLLNTWEVSQLKLNNELVVLSACNTAYGDLNRGEGMLSLSRGFIKAGCKSILSTLWSVSDKTSASVMDYFYNGLFKNWTKSKSLSEAKRHYLRQHSGMEAHPFYWSGYVVSGKDAPVAINSSKPNRYLVAGFISIVMAALVYYIRINRKKKNRD